MRYRVGDPILKPDRVRRVNGRQSYVVCRVDAVNDGMAIGWRVTNRTLAWSPINHGSWLVLENDLTVGVEKKFEEAKMLALYPEVLDRIAAITRHGKK